MEVRRLDHFLIRTKKPDETCRFFVDILGLREGWRPAFQFRGYWLYKGDDPIVHIADISGAADAAALASRVGGGAESEGTGSVDHIAFRCTGYASLREALERRGLSHIERDVEETRERQVFLQDPNGIKLELNFPVAEALGDNALLAEPVKQS